MLSKPAEAQLSRLNTARAIDAVAHAAEAHNSRIGSFGEILTTNNFDISRILPGCSCLALEQCDVCKDDPIPVDRLWDHMLSLRQPSFSSRKKRKDAPFPAPADAQKPNNLIGLTDCFKKLKLDGVDDGQDGDQVQVAASFHAAVTENGEADHSQIRFIA